MCGIAGVVLNRDAEAAYVIYDALTVIQHRGQDAAGIATCDGANRLHMRKDNGLVQDVFTEKNMLELPGHVGIGHVRYPTAGTSSNCESQPFYVNSPYGILIAHNGNLTNSFELTQELFLNDLRHLNTQSDSEVLLNILAHELGVIGKLQPSTDDMFKAVEGVHRRCKGAYAVISLVLGHGLLAFRDPYGIRPLIIGERRTLYGTEYMIASESVALTVLGFQVLRDVAPGEAIFIDLKGQMSTRQCAENPSYHPCLFEYVYMARPDSILDGVSVYKARLRMGTTLAHKILREFPDHDIDVVIPIPDTSRTSALPIAHELGIKYREGFIKNRYIGRTFIMAAQKLRQKSIRQKLSPIPLEFRDKNVLLVDDSIVRGNTSKQIVQMARDAGARKVYLASAAPPVRYQNVYGIDMPAQKELAAHGRTLDEIALELGADRVFYQDLDDLQMAVREGNPRLQRCEASCFDGEYVTMGITQDYLHHLEMSRSDEVRT